MGYFEVEKIPLKVLTNDGFGVDSGVSVKETELLFNSDTNNAPTFFYNSGDTGIELEVSVLVKPEYTFDGKKIAAYLDYWSKWSKVVTVVTNAFDVPNGKYILTVKSKKQTNKTYSLWKIRFKQYYENELSFESNNLSKGYSLSTPVLTLQKYTKVNKSSPKEAILALQILLQENGSFTFITVNSSHHVIPRKPNGVWDNLMVSDIINFQRFYGLGNKQGVCDRETILALIRNNIGSGLYGRYKGYVEL